MSKAICIICLERKESYTEVNFFNGFKNHQDKLDIFCAGLSKAVHTCSRKKNEYKINQVIVPIMTKYTNIIFFFIADGDKKEHLNAINETYYDVVKCLKSKLKIIESTTLRVCNSIFHKIIIPSNKKFEEEIGSSNLSKKKSNVNLLNDYLEKNKLFTNNQLDWQLLLKKFEKSVYYIIFKTIKN